MNKQKKGIIALAVVLIAVVGIGYAALTDQLLITGKTSALAADFGVEFAEGETPEVSQYNADDEIIYDVYTVQAPEPNSENRKSAAFNVAGLKRAGDYVVIEYLVQNTGDVAANVTLNVDPIYDENYEIDMNNSDSVRIEPDSYEWVPVRVKLSKVFVDEEAAAEEHQFTIELNAEVSE